MNFLDFTTSSFIVPTLLLVIITVNICVVTWHCSDWPDILFSILIPMLVITAAIMVYATITNNDLSLNSSYYTHKLVSVKTKQLLKNSNNNKYYSFAGKHSIVAFPRGLSGYVNKKLPVKRVSINYDPKQHPKIVIKKYKYTLKKNKLTAFDKYFSYRAFGMEIMKRTRNYYKIVVR